MKLIELSNYQYNPHAIPVLIIGIMVLVSGYFINAKNRSAAVNQWFFALSISIAVWLLATALAYSSRDPKIAEFWLKIDNFGVLFISLNVYAFVKSFLKKPISKMDMVFYSIVFLVGVVHLISPILVVGVYKYYWGYFPRWSVFGFGFLAIFFSFMAASFWLLLRNFRTLENGQVKNQARYIFLAFACAYTGSSDFLPTFGIEVYPFGFISISLLYGIIAIAIVKHHLMEIEVIIRRATVFAGLFTFVYGIFTAVTILGKEFFHTMLSWNDWVATIPTVLVITVTLRPLERLLTDATEKYLFQKKYDYRQLLKTFADEVLTVLNIQQLPEQTVSGLVRILKLENVSILLLDRDSGVYKVATSIGIKDRDQIYKQDSTLITYLKKTQSYILKDKSADKIEGDGELKDSFRKLEATLCLPISLHDDLIGVLCLGMKKSGEDFIQEDIDILGALARTLAIALANAQLFDELSKTQAEAAQREKMAVIGTLAAGINHEICNPLGIVRGQCEMFLLNSRDGFYKQKSAEEILKLSSDIMGKVIKETDRATGITKRLSSFAKPSKRSDMDEVLIEKEVEEVVGLVEHDLKLNNIEVQRDFPHDFPIFLADRKQIQEVLFNIIRNAAQAIEKHEGKIVISGFTDNGTIIVRIADNGSGIPADKINQIFNPFYTTKAPGKGTGLGLFIVKQVIEKNKGTIQVESEVGMGTTFTLRFPSAMKAIAHDSAA